MDYSSTIAGLIIITCTVLACILYHFREFLLVKLARIQGHVGGYQNWGGQNMLLGHMSAPSSCPQFLSFPAYFIQSYYSDSQAVFHHNIV